MVWTFHGKCLDDTRCLIERGPQERAWITLREGAVRSYFHESYTSDARRKLILRARFDLTPVSRAAKLDQRLHIERE